MLNKTDDAQRKRLERGDVYDLRKLVGQVVRIYTSEKIFEDGKIVEVTPHYVILEQIYIIKYKHDGMIIPFTRINKIMKNPQLQPKEQLSRAQQNYLKEYAKIAG